MHTHPSQFEPLLPQKNVDVLIILAQEITRSSVLLKNSLHSTTALTIAKLLRSMNSYYSNKIEGQNTHPLNIEKSLKKDFSIKPSVAKLQRIALAHIEAEKEIESWIINDKDFSPFSETGTQKIHAALYRHLSLEDRTTEDGKVVEPGILRDGNVEVGRHIPPSYESISAFLKRYETVYSTKTSWDHELIKIACAHQRLSWIHPFWDGNGRVTRLASHAALYHDFTSGLWSICRGLARTHRKYYEALAYADEPRHSDLDGRGNLTEKGLWNFCHYFLTICLDQVNFMRERLDLENIRKRIRILLIERSQYDKEIRLEAEIPLHYLFISGSLKRNEFKQLTGLGDRVAQALLSKLLKTGLVESDTPLGPIRFGLPLDSLQIYFPDLYPEAAEPLD